MNLSEYIDIDTSISRSVNIERDLDDNNLLERYQVTPMSKKVLKRFADALEGESVSAWSLTGPYGTGKSAFALFLLQLCRGMNDQNGVYALDKIREGDQALAERFHKFFKKSNNTSFFTVGGTSKYEALNITLLRALKDALAESLPDLSWEQEKALKRIHKQCSSLLNTQSPATEKVVELFEATHASLERPIAIVVDEFGKSLEFMAHNAGQGDIFALQLLAESGYSYLWVCLHQAFGEYANSLSYLQKEEWQKIQGRFEDVAFVEPVSRTFNLIKDVLGKQRSVEIPNGMQKWIDAHKSYMHEIKVSGLPDIDSQLIESIYPIHPLAVLALGELSRIFAQNDRTLFSFLSSGESNAFKAFLDQKIQSDHPLPTLSLDYLYDYFSGIMVLHYGDRSKTQKWIEIQSLIDAHRCFHSRETRILKTIGILNLLGSIDGMAATSKMIHVALSSSYYGIAEEINSTMEKFRKSGTLIFRRYANEYRLWEGSDFDLESALLDERSRLALRPIDEILEEGAPQEPVIAARHAYTTGTVRIFKQNWINLKRVEDPPNDLWQPGDSDGQIWFVVGDKKRPHGLKNTTKGRRNPVVIAYAPCLNHVKELAIDAAAAISLLSSNQQLLHDGIARREAQFRAGAARDELRRYIETVFEPGAGQAWWYAQGARQTISSHRDLKKLISEICDKVYDKCPHINNEMINSDHISGSAARARREMAEAMVGNEAQEQLGLEGYGAEVALYRTLIKQNGLHVPSNKKWKFVPPTSKTNANLLEIWKTLDKQFVANDNGEGVQVSQLIDYLSKPPYGMRKGPLPLLICHYLLVKSDEIALYEEDVYKPYFTEADFALLVKRPELFYLKKYAPTGVDREVVRAYIKVLNTDILDLDENSRNPSLLKIVNPLIQFMQGLNDYSRFTRRISLNAQKLRSAVLNAREPIRLLFEDIPRTLNIEPDALKNNERRTEFCNALQKTLIELNDAYGQLKEEIENVIVLAFKPEANNGGGSRQDQLRQSLRKHLQPLKGISKEPELNNIIDAVCRTNCNYENWLCGIAGQITAKPPDCWRDNDIEPFRATTLELADRIESLNTLVLDGRRFSDGDRLVLSMMDTSGRCKRKVVKLSDAIRKDMREKHASILKMPAEERIKLCAVLNESFAD